jgi:uncharacterized membrane protein YidH (DUF202 family)
VVGPGRRRRLRRRRRGGGSGRERLARVERALRLGQPLPAPRALAVLAGAVVVLAALVVVLALLEIVRR